MRFLRFVPFFFILLVIYNIGMVATAGDNGHAFQVNPSLFKVPLLANDKFFLLTLSEVFAMLGIIFLYFEVLKATRTSRDTLIDHMLSMVTFVICLIEFMAVPGAGTSSFMILTLLSLIDVIMGFTVSYATARRDISLGTQG